MNLPPTTIFGFKASLRLVDERGNELLIEDFLEDYDPATGLVGESRRDPAIDTGKILDTMRRAQLAGDFDF